MGKELQLDKWCRTPSLRRWLKRLKNRFERRKAKDNPETSATYNRYKGWGS